MVHRPIRSLLAQSNEAQRGSPQGQVGPKPQLGPPEPFLAIKTLRTHFGQGPLFSPWPLAPPDQLSSLLALNSRGILPIPPCTLYSRLQEWCIYGIIYHYAPFLLRNSMVTFSGPNSMIPNQGPKIQFPFQRRTLQRIGLAIHGGYQKTIQGPQPPGPAGVGLGIISGLFQGPFSEVINY
ncbi:hypothetical protein O181_031833 [Austropuccinia psidii MF-1]|uniref:Uncharacterized protein n=1 Tax=Austropuccinia psidii MF-1 TaxID=1389203 RepID=A0A9Q3D0I1_9BASI|nr:hypothetical protein [Austropuccinia psidii MF-1]